MKKRRRSETRSRGTRKQFSRTSWSRSIILVVFIISLAAALLGAPESFAAQAAYPSKPISIICPWSPGSAVDLLPRMMAPQLSKRLGVPVNIINKPGGSGVPGTMEAVKAAPDGYTILADCPGTTSIHAAWIKDLPYIVEERTFIALGGVFPSAFNVRADAPWKTLQDVEQAMRKDPASFRWGGVGASHADFALFLLKAALKKKGVDVDKTKTVSFPAGANTQAALAGGHVDLTFGSRGVSQPYVDAGKVRRIAVSRAERTDVFPGLSTTKEQGFPSVITDFWVGFSGPAGLPKDVIQTWERHVKEIVNDPALLPEWEKTGGQPEFLASEQFKKYVLDEISVIKAISAP